MNESSVSKARGQMMKTARAPMLIDELEPMVEVYVDEDDYSIDCGELEDTEGLVAGRSLRQTADD